MFFIVVNFSNWLVIVNDLLYDDNLLKVIGKVGDDFVVKCEVLNFEFKFVVWELCGFRCCFLIVVWKMVVKVDYGNIVIINCIKYDMVFDGLLILKVI